MSVDLSVSVGSITLPNPVMVASGTAGHSTELSAYLDLAGLGAFVVKSLSADPWGGNPGPRIHQTPAGMINSVGLQGPGVAAWLGDGLARLRRIGVERIVVSIWGRTVDEYRRAARMLAEAPASVIGVEVNLSCPNLDGGRHLFAHDPDTAAEVIAVCGVADRPLWAKLSPNTDRTAEVAGAVAAAGAEAVTLTNTLLGMSIDPRPVGRARSGAGAGRLRSGHPSGSGASCLRLPGRSPTSPSSGWVESRPRRCRRVPARRCSGVSGRNGHIRRSPSSPARAG